MCFSETMYPFSNANVIGYNDVTYHLSARSVTSVLVGLQLLSANSSVDGRVSYNCSSVCSRQFLYSLRADTAVKVNKFLKYFHVYFRIFGLDAIA